MKTILTANSFADLAKKMHDQDIAKAAKLRKSAALRKGKVKNMRGPAVAR